MSEIIKHPPFRIGKIQEKLKRDPRDMKPKIHSAAVSQCGHLIYGVGLILLLHYVTNLIF